MSAVCETALRETRQLAQLISPLLSICITTRNRAALLSQTLDTILPQLTDACQLVIVDGGSSDATQSNMVKLAQDHPQLLYHRLETSDGLDPDYDLAVQLAGGRYAWLFTDDDYLLPDAVARVLAHLASEPDLLLVNAKVTGPDMVEVLAPGMLAQGLGSTTIAPGDADTLLTHATMLLTFIGSVVIRRQLWIEQDLKSFYGSGFVHVGAIFSRPLTENAMIDALPYVQIRYGNASWTWKSFKVWNHDWPQMVWSLPSVSDLAKAQVIERYPAGSFKRLVEFKIKCCYQLEIYEKYVKVLKLPVLVRMAAWLLAVCPSKLFNRIARTYFRMRGNRDPMTWFELDAAKQRLKNPRVDHPIA